MGAELAILLSARDQASRVLNQVGQSAQQLSVQLNQGLGGAIRSLGSIAGAPARALGGLVDVFGRVGLAVFGVRETIEIFKGALDGLIGPAEDMQRAQTQLNAVLASTGGVAGVSAEAANALAESLSQVTTFSGRATLETENLLLTFTNIGKDIFPQATEAALNMSIALGQDTKASAIQLGKALQDPILGITALRRVGVNFSDAQKEVVKQMVATGHSAEAQAYILKELQTEFGNSARAAGETFSGKLAILGNQFEHLKETVGAAVLPVLSQLLDALTPLLAKLGEELPGAIAVVEDALGRLGGAFQSVWSLVQPFAAGLLEIATTLAGGDFQGALDKAGEMLNGIVESISGWVTGDGPGQILAALVGLADSAWDWLKTAADSAGEHLGAWIDSVKTWADGDGTGKIKDALLGLAASAWEWLKTAASNVGDALEQNLVIPIKNWVAAGGIRKVADSLLGLAASAWDWVKEAAAQAGEKLGGIIAAIANWNSGVGQTQLATAFIGFVNHAWDWVTTAGATAIEKLGGLVDFVSGWVKGGGLANMVTALEGLAAGAWAWVLKAKDTAIEKLGGLVDGVKAWIDAGGPGLVAAQLSVLAEHAWDWVQQAVTDAAGKLGPIIQSVRDWVTDYGWPEFKKQGDRLGTALSDGISAGFQVGIKAGNLQPAIVALQGALEKVRIPENLTTGLEAVGGAFRILAGWVNLLIGVGGPSGGGLQGLLALKKKVDDFFGAAGFQLLGALVIAFKNFALGILEVLSALDRLVRGKDDFKQAIEDIGLLFKNLTGVNTFQIGGDLVQGLINGITSMLATIQKTVTGLGQSLPQWLKDVLRISSPSQVLYEIGLNIGQGLALGINAETPAVAKAAGNLMGGVLGQISTYGNRIHDEVSGIVADLARVGGASAVGAGPQPSASGRVGPVPGGSASSGLPWGGEFGYPHPYTGDPRMNPPGFVPAPLQSHPVAHFYGNNFFNGPSMLDALNELGQMVG